MRTHRFCPCWRDANNNQYHPLEGTPVYLPSSFCETRLCKTDWQAMLFNYSTAKPLAEVRHTLWYGEKCCILMQVAASLWNAGGVNKGHVISEVLLRETAFCLRAQRPTKVHQVFSHSGLLPACRTGCNVFDNPRLLIKQTKNSVIQKNSSIVVKQIIWDWHNSR